MAAIAEAVRDAGGRALIVGGWVRDQLLGRESKDVDIEVFGVPAERLRALLEALRPRRSGRRELPGLQVRRHRRVAAAARIEGRPRTPRLRRHRRSGHVDRRGGAAPRLHHQRDLVRSAHRRVSRPVRRTRGSRAAACCASSIRATFGDDSLRVLRAVQFAARFDLALEPETRGALPRDSARRSAGRAHLGRGREAAAARRARRSASPSRSTSASSRRLFPELQALVGCPQEPEWHPEGDVWVHTLQVIDQARTRIDDLPRPQQLAIMLGAVCHDFGKPATTAVHRRPHPLDRSRGAGRRAGARVPRSPQRALDRRLRRARAGRSA